MRLNSPLGDSGASATGQRHPGLSRTVPVRSTSCEPPAVQSLTLSASGTPLQDITVPDYAQESAIFRNRYGISGVLAATVRKRGIMDLRSWRRLNRYSNSARQASSSSMRPESPSLVALVHDLQQLYAGISQVGSDNVQGGYWAGRHWRHWGTNTLPSWAACRIPRPTSSARRASSRDCSPWTGPVRQSRLATIATRMPARRPDACSAHPRRPMHSSRPMT